MTQWVVADVTASLHELVFVMDRYADTQLRARYGIDQSRFAFLRPLLDSTVDVTRLAEALNLTKAAVSKRVPVLAAEGWLVASADTGHGRRVLVSLTPAGRAVVEQAATELNEGLADVLAGVSIDPRGLAAQLRALIAAVRALPPPKEP